MGSCRKDLDTHVSHVISAKERAYFNLPKANDGPANYRNTNAYTNQSVHQRIDNFFLAQSRRHKFDGDGFNSGRAGNRSYISFGEVARRVQRKIDVAKQTGDIHNSRFRNYLRKAADAANLDLRQFNGYN